VTDLSVIATPVGPADVLHRLALGVEPRDAIGRAPVATAVRVGQEVPRRMRPRAARFEDAWPCLDFETNGMAKFKLRYQIGGPRRIKVNQDGSPPRITVRIDDFRRRFVPRRFRIALWTKLELESADPTPGAGPTGPYVPMASRLLRPFLFPGAMYTAPRGTTAIRGRVVTTQGKEVRWPRVIAKNAGDEAVGIAHGDEHGEFLLIITDLGTMPALVTETFEVDLEIFAWKSNAAPTPDPTDRVADLVVESVDRTHAADPDNPVLLGIEIPSDYTQSTTAKPHFTVTVGELLALYQPVVFRP